MMRKKKKKEYLKARFKKLGFQEQEKRIKHE